MVAGILQILILLSCDLQKMMETWHSVIFSRIEDRIKECAMQLITDERNGESIDGQLVVAVRESLGE